MTICIDRDGLKDELSAIDSGIEARQEEAKSCLSKFIRTYDETLDMRLRRIKIIDQLKNCDCGRDPSAQCSACGKPVCKTCRVEVSDGTGGAILKCEACCL